MKEREKKKKCGGFSRYFFHKKAHRKRCALVKPKELENNATN
jgi:hypothetical protein